MCCVLPPPCINGKDMSCTHEGLILSLDRTATDVIRQKQILPVIAVIARLLKPRDFKKKTTITFES